MNIVNLKIKRRGRMCAKRLNVRVGKSFAWIPWVMREDGSVFFGWLWFCGFSYW